MRILNYAALLGGSLTAAAGQIMLKHGADGRAALVEFINGNIALGLLLYIVGAVLWIYALAREPLSAVYPFTVLTFVLVMAGSALVLREPISASLAIGIVVVLTGLAIVMFGQLAP
jgi:drug/metabolite transporter (DMT)-like permease